MGRTSTRQAIDLSNEERARLEDVISNPRSLQKPVGRVRIVLDPGARIGMRVGRDPAADGRVEADGRALARRLGRRLGMVSSPVHGILKENGLRPHPVKTFKVSRDPRFAIKVRDVVGLSVDPPDHAVVLSVDETTPIQALGRTQRPLPLKPGPAETRTHD